MKYAWFVLIMMAFLKSNAVPYRGEVVPFRQPDGTMVQVRLYGDEYYIRAESMDGYTLIRDEETKWICYAKLSGNHAALESTGFIYTGKPTEPNNFKKNADVSKHLDISEKARRVLKNKNERILEGESVKHTKKETRGTPIQTVSGNIKGLCIVVDFPDEPGIVPISAFEDFCNDMTYTGYGNKGSLRTYYHDISGGLVDYENVVFGYYRAPHTFTYYDSLPYARGARIILDSALRWIASQGFDFSTLSINPDNTIRAINLMYTGVPPTWAEGMWHHKGSYTGFSANGVSSKDYNCSPANEPLKLSVVAHENGHMIGKWPDTYKYTNTAGDDGIGTFDLMCWPGNDGFNPVPPNPLFRSNAGWGKVVDITGYNGLQYDTANSYTCYRYINMNDTNEMFLIENRLKDGRSLQIEDQGLTIWHIDRNGNNQTTHHEVFLEHADNDSTKNDKACFRNGFNKEFGNNSVPDSKFYNGDPSGLRVWDISNMGNIMNYKLGSGSPSSLLRLLYSNISNDNNGNGSIEPGEDFRFNLKALNRGEINSLPATIRCEAIGNTASYIQIENPQYAAAIINAGDSIPVTFQAGVNSSTPVGTELRFKFTISDGHDSIYITKVYTAGDILNMDNQDAVSCSAVFFDDGGVGDYKNNKTYMKTFLPEDSRKPVKVMFQEFNTEGGDNCEYDYLEVYNGKDSTSPLLGRYCNTNSPGTLISSDSSGALTFVFHSDEEDSRPGWKAIITCMYMHDNIPEDGLNIFPNPGSGQYTVRSYTEKIHSLNAYDIMGRRIMQYNNVPVNELQMNLNAEQSGIYIIQIKTDNKIITRKVALQR